MDRPGFDDVIGGWIPVAGLFLTALTYLTATAAGRTSRTRRTLLWVGSPGLVLSCLALAVLSYDIRALGSISAPTRLLITGWTIAVSGPLLLAVWLRGRDAWANAVAAVWLVALLYVREGAGDTAMYAWWALGAVGLVAWGVRDARVERINLGAALFAATVLTFYFSQVMDKLGRSASLFGLGLPLPWRGLGARAPAAPVDRANEGSAMTPLRRGLLVAALHALIVGSLGVKLLVDRATRPREWVRVLTGRSGLAAARPLRAPAHRRTVGTAGVLHSRAHARSLDPPTRRRAVGRGDRCRGKAPRARSDSPSRKMEY